MKRVLQNPDLIVAGIADLDSQDGVGMEEEIAQAERDLRSIQMEEDRAIRLFVSGKITEAQLDLQRRFITERLESARAKLDDYLVQETSGAEKRRLMEEVLTWAREFGQGLDEVTPEERHDYLQMLVEEVVIDRDNNVDITLALPIDDDSSDPDSPDPESPQPECVSIGSQETFSLRFRIAVLGTVSTLPIGHGRVGSRSVTLFLGGWPMRRGRVVTNP